MPVKSIVQAEHLDRLNNLPQTIANRFKKGQEPYNIKYIELPRNKYRQPIIPCIDCRTTMVTIYSPTKRCKTCSYIFRRETQRLRISKNGYLYSEGGKRPRPEHVVIVEKILNRKLKRNELVHHINMIKIDNRKDNLLVCDKKYHMRLHHKYAFEFARRFLCLQR